MPPTVSVVIPAYNAERWLSLTIQSVLDQTFTDFEAIVVDDGSTDRTRAIAMSFADARLRYQYQENRGLSAARNAGIRSAQGRYVALLDADDLFRRDKLAKQVEALELHSNVGLLTCGFQLIDPSGRTIGEQKAWLEHPTIDLRSLLFWNPLLPSTLVVRREWLDRGGLFDEDFTRYEDWEFALRMAHAGCRIDYVRDVLVSYRRHGTNMSTAASLVPVATAAALRLMTRLFERDDLDDNIRHLRIQAFANVYLDAAARAYGAELGELGRVWLEKAIEEHAELSYGYPPRWLDVLCGHALDGLVADLRGYIATLVSNQPRQTSENPLTKRQVMAYIAAARAFRAHRDGSWRVARLQALQALLMDPLLARNRGLLAIGVRLWRSPMDTRH